MTVIAETATERAPHQGPSPADVEATLAGLAKLAGHRNVVDAESTRLIAAAIADGTWSGPGIHSVGQWVAWKLAVSPHHAKLLVKVAKARETHPATIARFDAGELSLDQVAEAVKAPPWAEASVARFAPNATVVQLRRAMREEFFTPDPDEPRPEPAPDRDRLSTRITDDHRWRISGETDLAQGHTIDAALATARDDLFAAGETDINDMDCLREVCERFLDGIEAPQRRDRTKMWIHLDVTSGAATTTDGWRLPDHLRDQLTCEGLVQPVWETEGRPFSIGRTSRVVPERTRRQVRRRDRGCRVPGCDRERHTEIHHIIHWLGDDGPSDTWNLITLCRLHHRLHHLGLLGIAGDADRADGVTFTDRHGNVIPPVGHPIPPTGPPPEPTGTWRPPCGERLYVDNLVDVWVHPNALAQRAERARQCSAARTDGRPPR